jgi:hypothetical protein
MSERLRRWRLILGGEDADGTGEDLSGADLKRDKTLDALYGEEKRRGGLGGSSPRVARWLGDIRGYFPASVVQVMQRDAMDRLGLRQLLLEPELLESVQPDVHLVGTLLSLNQAIPARRWHRQRHVNPGSTQPLEDVDLCFDRPPAPLGAVGKPQEVMLAVDTEGVQEVGTGSKEPDGAAIVIPALQDPLGNRAAAVRVNRAVDVPHRAQAHHVKRIPPWVRRSPTKCLRRSDRYGATLMKAHAEPAGSGLLVRLSVWERPPPTLRWHRFRRHRITR